MYGEIGTATIMKEILFIHSAGPQGHHEGSDYLVRYLIEALGPGYHVSHPVMPDPENPHYNDWRRGRTHVRFFYESAQMRCDAITGIFDE